MVSYYFLCHQGAAPWTARRRSLQVLTDSLILRGIHPPGESGWGPWMYNGTQWGAGTSEGRGIPLIRLVRTWVQIQACPRRQKGRLITSLWETLVTAFFGVKPCFSGSGNRVEVLWYVRVYENVSWDAAQLQSEWHFPHSVSVWQSGNRRRWVEIRVKTLPWSVSLITLKRDLMETMELTQLLTS
jgi:hypothetical protein